MKPGWLTPAMLRNFERIKGMGVAVVVLALIPWMAQDFISSLAATQMTTHTTLRTTLEKDDARVTRAFESARRNNRIEASLVTEQDPRQQTRDALLTITAGSKREALDGLATMTAAMKTAFAQGGGGELYDVGNTPALCRCRTRRWPPAQRVPLGRVPDLARRTGAHGEQTAAFGTAPGSDVRDRGWPNGWSGPVYRRPVRLDPRVAGVPRGPGGGAHAGCGGRRNGRRGRRTSRNPRSR